MADMRRQFQQEDLATGLSLAKAGPWEMNLAQGYAAGAGAGRELMGMFGNEDPRIQEQRAVARAIDDGDPAQRREPGRRLYVDREWPRPGRDWGQGHAARRRDQRRLLNPHRLHCHRHLPFSYSRALRYR